MTNIENKIPYNKSYKSRGRLKRTYCQRGHLLTKENTIVRRRNRGRGEEINTECRECHYLRNRKYESKKDIKLYKKFSHIKRTYKITEEEYNNLLSVQNNKCLICGRELKDLSTGLCVDHDHNTNIIRGLLCKKCNGSLGWYELYMTEIKEYLNKNNGNIN